MKIYTLTVESFFFIEIFFECVKCFPQIKPINWRIRNKMTLIAFTLALGVLLKLFYYVIIIEQTKYSTTTCWSTTVRSSSSCFQKQSMSVPAIFPWKTHSHEEAPYTSLLDGKPRILDLEWRRIPHSLWNKKNNI